MLFLITAILFSSTLSILMRVSEKYTSNNIAILVVNYIVCAVITAFSIGPGGFAVNVAGLDKTLLYGFMGGAFYLAGFVMLQLNITKNGVVLPSTFNKLSLLVSTGCSIVFFGERPDMIQLTGFAVAIAAIILINSEKTSGTKANFILGLILLMISTGLGDTMSKLYEETCPPQLSNHYLITTFITAAALCWLVMLYYKQHIGKKEILLGVIMGVPNFFSSSLVLRALSHMDAMIVFPTFSVGCIFVVAVAGIFFFGEKLSKRQFLSLGMIMSAIVMLNI